MRRPYPRNDDVRRAIVRVLSQEYMMHPAEFPEKVFKELIDSGFFVRHLTVKRIWRIYEEMVKKGVIDDILGVVKR